MSTIFKSNGSSPINTIFDDIIDPYSLNNNNNNIATSITTNSTIIPTNSTNILVKSSSSSLSSPSKSSSQNSLSSVAKELCQQQLQSNEQKSTFLMCFLCNQQLREPKLLSCLHSLCRNCLLIKSASESNEFSLPVSVNCPKCEQETVITGSNGIDSLEDDYIAHNLLEMLAIEEMIMNCSSCKTDAKAVSRCINCADFLCSNCVSAHKYMKVFEDHQVVQIQKKVNESNSCGSSSSSSSGSSSSSSTYSNSSNEPDLLMPIHKPLFCKIHPKENLKFFCNTCQVIMHYNNTN
jgi:tripartite motif-containing protein 2/3